MGSILLPDETDAVLVVDPDRVLPGPVAFQCLQPVAGRHAKVVQHMRRVQHRQFALRHPFEIDEAPDPLAPGKAFGVAAGEAADHT